MIDTRAQGLQFLDTVMYSNDEDMRRGAYNRVSLHIKQQHAALTAAGARCADCTTEHLAAQARVEELEKVRDMLAVMGADLDAETTGAGSTPEDWIGEARRRIALVDDLRAAAREAVRP